MFSSIARLLNEVAVVEIVDGIEETGSASFLYARRRFLSVRFIVERSVTEVIPFGGNTFQGPWDTCRKRQLAQKILAYVEIRRESHTRAS